jgi:hypothetical protein
MLGKLTDEFSCANSRFFRTSHYSNKEISDYLRYNFILHWQSVRPVPRVTIDFGDGRRLERTLTGNSAHYVLTSDGQPLDVLPGLYGPARFKTWLAQTLDFHQIYTTAPAPLRADALVKFHARRLDRLVERWNRDIECLDEPHKLLVAKRLESASPNITFRPLKVSNASFGNSTVVNSNANVVNAPGAVRAGQLALGKGKIEMPLLQFANLGGERLEKAMDDDLWKSIANLHREEVKLDAASVAVMRAEFPDAAQAGRVAPLKYVVEDPILRVVRQFESSAALDTVRNEYVLHRRIHEEFAAGDAAKKDVDDLNEWVYAELFLTPSSDPWLGLAPPDVYTALENGGQVAATTGQNPGRE